MNNDIAGIRVESPFFKEGLDCDLFLGYGKRKDTKYLKPARLSLVYGKNGTGKSTISTAFRLASTFHNNKFNDNIKQISNAYFYNKKHEPIPQKQEIITHVFNEEYMMNNILLKKEGLGTIVVFSNDTKLIKEYRKKLDIINSIKEEINSTNRDIETFQNHLKTLIPAIERVLENNGYYDRFNIISDEENPVSTEGSLDFIAMNTEIGDEEYKLAQVELNQLLDVIKKLNVDKRIDKDYCSILTIEKINAFKKEYDIGIDQEDFPDQISNQMIALAKKPLDYLADEIDANSALGHIQESDQFEYLVFLNNDRPKQLSLKHIFDIMTPDNQDKLKELLDQYNQEVQRLDLLVDQRMASPYQDENLNVDVFLQISNQLRAFIDATISHSFDNNQYLEIIHKADELNKKVTAKDISSLTKEYNAMKILVEYQNKNSESKKLELENAQKEFSSIEEKVRDTTLPIERINKSLAYILCSKSRLQVVAKDGHFFIQSNHNDVQLEAISTAEKNILSLVYFMTSVYFNYNKKECILVLDDPISSTDATHAMGIYNYLAKELREFMSLNNNNKCLCLSHDYTVYINMSKVFKNIRDYSNNDDLRTAFFELHPNHQLERTDLKNQNDYTNLLNDVFEFAKGNRDDLENYIGNITRKAIEAFCNFELNVKTSELSQHLEIFEYIDDEQLREYFTYNMFNIVLNNESHMDDAAKFSYDNNLIQYTSHEDLIRSTQDVLCFIYTLNPLHIRRHLGGKANTIKEWCQQIKELH